MTIEGELCFAQTVAPGRAGWAEAARRKIVEAGVMRLCDGEFGNAADANWPGDARGNLLVNLDPAIGQRNPKDCQLRRAAFLYPLPKCPTSANRG